MIFLRRYFLSIVYNCFSFSDVIQLLQIPIEGYKKGWLIQNFVNKL